MALHDISIRLSPATPAWPGDTPFACGWTWKMADGASVNVSTMSGSPHVGTHADAPIHVRDGGAGAHELPLSAFVGPAQVVDVDPATTTVSFEELALLPGVPVARLLLRTGATIAHGKFPERWPVLTTACVDQLLRAGLVLLGVDCPSVDARESRTLDVHHHLFDGGAYILENLDLRGVAAGRYELLAPPLAVEGVDAAPVRAVLRSPAGE